MVCADRSSTGRRWPKWSRPMAILTAYTIVKNVFSGEYGFG
jgi:hypothetical protein